MTRPDTTGRPPDGHGTTVVNRARVQREPDAVFDYLTDLPGELGWNDKLLEVHQLTEGDLRPGSSYRVRFAGPVGESVITYEELDRPNRWRTSSSSPRLDVQLLGTVATAEGGCEVTLVTTLRPRGLLRALTPFVGRTMQTSWEHHLATMKRTLEATA